MIGVEDSMMIAAALDSVGPRLRRLRTQRGVTLADLSGATGISKSTLSRRSVSAARVSTCCPLAKPTSGCTCQIQATPSRRRLNRTRPVAVRQVWLL